MQEPDDHEDDLVPGEGDDGRPESAPPHPLDRVWVHPSELPARGPVAVPTLPSERPRRTRPRAAALALSSAAVGALAVVGILLLAGALDSGDSPRSGSSDPFERSSPAPGVIETAVDKAGESVVEVRAAGAHGGRSGSGVSVRHDGELLTSDRIVAGADMVVVVDHEGDEHVAEVVGRDPDSGLALLRVDAPLRAATLSDTTFQTGDTARAVGAHPGGGDPWVSEGIVSATDLRVGAGGLAIKGAVATDVRPGAAGVGGALIDSSGGIAAIVLAPVAADATTYAVPIRAAVDIADALREHGSVPRGWMGVRGRDGALGVRVVETVGDGPAAKAGIRPGDMVRALDGVAVARMSDLLVEIRALEPGDTVEVDVVRDGEWIPMEVRVGRGGGEDADALAEPAPPPR
jgi:S1-C subfamily serine protease